MRVAHLEGTNYAWTFALFPDACADLGIAPRHVLHVGGHLGQEVEHYRTAGVKRITYMEPTPECAAYLRNAYPDDDVDVVEAAAGEPGIGMLSLCGGDGAWNTLRSDIGQGEGVHAEERVIAVTVVPIRVIQQEAVDDGLPVDVLVVDTQGTEVEALATAKLLPDLRLIVVETQASGHPEAAHVDDVSAHLHELGWVPVLAWNHERPNAPHATFADVFYVPASAASAFNRDR